jgi:hypothetical protein
VVEKEKLGKKLIFLSTLAFNFSSLWPWNPLLFTGSGRGTFHPY